MTEKKFKLVFSFGWAAVVVIVVLIIMTMFGIPFVAYKATVFFLGLTGLNYLYFSMTRKINIDDPYIQTKNGLICRYCVGHLVGGNIAEHKRGCAWEVEDWRIKSEEFYAIDNS